jgi:hypothetical protein
MDHSGPPTPNGTLNRTSRLGTSRLGTSRLGTIALIVVLFGLLVAATVFAIRSWTSIEGPPMPEVGYVAMTIGVVFSLLIGFALMALLFYSSRHGYDERASRGHHVDGVDGGGGERE